MPGKHDIKELQKTAIMDTEHSLESTNVKVQNIQHKKYRDMCHELLTTV